MPVRTVSERYGAVVRAALEGVCGPDQIITFDVSAKPIKVAIACDDDPSTAHCEEVLGLQISLALEDSGASMASAVTMPMSVSDDSTVANEVRELWESMVFVRHAHEMGDLDDELDGLDFETPHLGDEEGPES